MPAGRPTTYNAEYLKKSQEYLDSCADSIVDGKTVSVNIPSIAGLSVYLGVWKTQLYEWGDLAPEFDDMLTKIKTEQERRLLNGGLSSQYNPTITKLMLAKHDYRDSQELTGKDGERLIPEAITPEDKEKLLSLIK